MAHDALSGHVKQGFATVAVRCLLLLLLLLLLGEGLSVHKPTRGHP